MKRRENLLAKDKKYVWHPYTQAQDAEKFPPLLIKRAKGIKLYDASGKFYYDTISSWWCNVHGHNHPIIKNAIKKQLGELDHVLFAGVTHEPAIRLAEEIIALAPKSLTKVFFSDNGSTAVEVALKMSFQYWKNTGCVKKEKFIALDAGYHGDTVGTMSVSGVDLFTESFAPLFFSSFKVPSPYCYRCPMNKERKSCHIDCLSPLEKLLKDKSDEIAGIILEPFVLGAGGMIIYPKEYLSGVGKLAKKFNVHLIVDEVATGFGRTGKMFASEYAGIKPDLMCVSKGITAGYLPLAATLATEKIARAFYAPYIENKTFYHGHTYTANPIACAAGLGSLEVFKKEKTLEHVKKIIPEFHRLLNNFRDLPLVGDIRAIGLIGALELVKDKKTKESFKFKERIGFKVYNMGLKKNLLLRPLGGIIYLFLPLCIKKDELEDIMHRAYNVIKSL